ncbi:lysine methyltransferase [Nitzschia inconspicua]|uniref:Lysine methyltransferase n=1 Tax=Nitzschia inconspicua TaxID=303405 RepID=A0A9K3Q4U0_9STRA|nr:lysine methyltransferase [Nitzschia inconspicua]
MGKKSKSSSSKEKKCSIDKTDDVGDEVVDAASSSNSKKMTMNEQIPPLEVSNEEYEELQSQVEDLSLHEAEMEWMESCRYGDVDVVRALVEKFPSLIHYCTTDNKNTGLHMASANGHVSVVKLLILGHHHPYSKNLAGNTPLHWAAANGQADVVDFLTTQTIVPIDVLAQNEFGRSALTEGFTSQKEQVVKSLLEHDSATEEKLLSTGKEIDHPTDLAEHVHHFFNPQTPLKIRELAMKNADNPFADTDRPDQDTTGLSIWSASLVIARWMQTKQDLWKDKSVLELGSGCGVPGLAIAAATTTCHPRHVYLTDLNPETVKNLQYNIELNQVQDFVTATCMDWSDQTTWPNERVDYLVGSDLIYQKSLVPLLSSVVWGTLKMGGTFFYVAPDTGRDGLDLFVQEMKSKCPGWKETVAPQEYHANPLINEDDEECFLHFQELSSFTYILYEFPLPPTLETKKV